jgi:hypothetical protein
VNALTILVLALSGAPTAVVDGGRCATLRAACRGPLSGFEVGWSDGNVARVRLELAAGETRELLLPLPLPAQGNWGEPSVRVEGAGDVNLDAEGLRRARAPDEDWRKVPAGLRLRAVPATLEVALGLRLPWQALCAAGACLAVVVHLRDRPRAALCASALGALLALSLARAAAPAAGVVEVLEGDGSTWLLARAAPARLDLDPGAGEHLESQPREAVLRIEGNGARWTVHAPLARLATRRAVADLEPGTLGDVNALEDLPRCWVRSARGLWSHRGPWLRGRPLPEATAGPAPPAALVAGLPPGRAILLAERARGEGAGSTSAWLRLVGFPDPDPGPAEANPPRD